MRLTERKTVEGYLKDIRGSFKKGTVLKNLIENSADITIEEAKQANPELIRASVNYIKLAERLVRQGFVPKQMGKVEDSSEERKALQKAFTLDTTKKIKLFTPEWYITAHELFIYHLIEAVFDASLLIEQGAARKFEEIVTLYRSFVEIEDVDGWFFAYYDRTVLFIDINKGRIYKAVNRVLRDKAANVGIKEIVRKVEGHKVLYYLVLNNDCSIPLMKDQKITNGLWKLEKSLKDNNKEYYNVLLKSRDNETETPAVQFPAHIILLLAKYGLNTIKHTILKDSLFTCDHLDMVGNHNALSNLELVTRRDNKLRASSKDIFIKEKVCSYDLLKFWWHIENSFNLNKVDVKMKQDSLKEYWSEVLQARTVEDVLAV